MLDHQLPHECQCPAEIGFTHEEVVCQTDDFFGAGEGLERLIAPCTVEVEAIIEVVGGFGGEPLFVEDGVDALFEGIDELCFVLIGAEVDAVCLFEVALSNHPTHHFAHEGFARPGDPQCDRSRGEEGAGVVFINSTDSIVDGGEGFEGVDHESGFIDKRPFDTSGIFQRCFVIDPETLMARDEPKSPSVVGHEQRKGSGEIAGFEGAQEGELVPFAHRFADGDKDLPSGDEPTAGEENKRIAKPGKDFFPELEGGIFAAWVEEHRPLDPFGTADEEHFSSMAQSHLSDRLQGDIQRRKSPEIAAGAEQEAFGEFLVGEVEIERDPLVGVG